MDAIGAEIHVMGRVQGVGYRAFAVEHARTLGLTGSCENLRDGRVRILVEGDRSSIESLVGFLRKGPRAAQVGHVEVTWTEWRGLHSAFDIKY